MIYKINQRPSEKSIYFWNITGSTANALLSVITLMFVTWMLQKEDGDIFSIAWAISQLMMTIGTFQMRMYQATDVTEKYTFQRYRLFRILTISLMIASSVLYIGVKGYEGNKAAVIFIVCIYRAIESWADVYEGWFQQKERLDLAGKAITYRVVFGLLVFGVVLYGTKDLMLGCIALLVSCAVCFILCDIRYAKAGKVFQNEKTSPERAGWMWRLAVSGAPLFVNAFIVMSIVNAPKMVIDKVIENGVLGQGLQMDFSILFIPAAFLMLVYIVFRPMITKMAILWNTENEKEYLKVLGKIFLYLSGISIILLAGTLLVGIPGLSLVYGIDLSQYKAALLVIVLGGCIYTFATVLDNALVIIRRQYVLVAAYIVTWLYIKAVSFPWVIKDGILGAALAYMTAMLVLLICTAILFFFGYKGARKKLRQEMAKHEN